MKMLCFKFDQNRTINEEIYFYEEGGNFEKKNMKTYKMASQNKSMFEVSTKSDYGKGFKNKGKITERNQLMWRNHAT